VSEDGGPQRPDAPAQPSAPGRPSAPGQPTSPGQPSARDLVRGPRRRRPAADTGRRHHIGNAPETLVVLLPDGTRSTTRTTALQLRDRTTLQLERMRSTIEAEMRQAATEAAFEQAAHSRDELARLDAELARRAAPPGPADG